MKKVLIISFLIFTILISFFSTSYAAITVTEENLESSFKKFAESGDNDDSSTTYSMNIDKENKKITLSLDNEDYIMDYDLSDKPTFKMDISFNNKMSKEECENESAKSTILIIMFVLISDSAGIEYQDSIAYISSAMFKDGQFVDSTDDSTSAIEYAKSRYDNMNETLIDDLFTWTNKKTAETDNEYNVQSTLTINNEADFSIMDGYFDNPMIQLGNTIQNSAQNAIDSSLPIMQNMVNGIQQATNTLQLSLNNAITQQQSVNKITNTITKLPQTGNSFELKTGLYLLCITSLIALIFIILKAIKYRKI